MKALRRGGVAAVIVALVSLVAQTGAYASPNGGALLLTGNGGFSPAVGTAATTVNVNWNTTATLGALFAGTGVSAGVYSCAFAGTAFGSLATGTANLQGNCQGGSLGTTSTLSCTIIWTRVGTVIVWQWVCPISTMGLIGSGSGTSSVVGIAYLVPTSIGTSVSSFAIQGVGALLGAN